MYGGEGLYLFILFPKSFVAISLSDKFFVMQKNFYRTTIIKFNAVAAFRNTIED